MHLHQTVHFLGVPVFARTILSYFSITLTRVSHLKKH